MTTRDGRIFNYLGIGQIFPSHRRTEKVPANHLSFKLFEHFLDAKCRPASERAFHRHKMLNQIKSQSHILTFPWAHRLWIQDKTSVRIHSTKYSINHWINFKRPILWIKFHLHVHANVRVWVWESVCMGRWVRHGQRSFPWCLSADIKLCYPKNVLRLSNVVVKTRDLVVLSLFD